MDIYIVKHFRHTDRSLELLREAAKNVISLVARPLRPSPKTHKRTDFGIRKKNDIENGSLLCVQEVVTPIYIIIYYTKQLLHFILSVQEVVNHFQFRFFFGFQNQCFRGFSGKALVAGPLKK